MIIKRKRKGNFTTLPNALFRNRDLSIGAKGLLGYLISLPANWEVRHYQLQHDLGIGRKVLSRYMREAIDAGYIKRDPEQGRDEHNRFTTYNYIVSDEPNRFGNEEVADVPAARRQRPERVKGAGNKKESTKTIVLTPLSPSAGARGDTAGLPRGAQANTVFVEDGSPQRAAWDAYDRATGRRSRPSGNQHYDGNTLKFGWWFSSLYPPTWTAETGEKSTPAEMISGEVEALSKEDAP